MEDHGDEIAVLYEGIGDYWKPRFLIDHKNRRACEFMTRQENLLTVTLKDIRWEMLRGLPEEAMVRVRFLSAHFPTCIGTFSGGRAEVYWRINPDGRYYMDEDGFGMSNDKEIALCGTIDRCGKVVARFRLARMF